MLKEKIALGTVQLGLPYGINNRSGKPNELEAYRILGKAAEEKIFLLDSAAAYGDSISVLGSYLKKNKDLPFKVISKFIAGKQAMFEEVETTLSLIGQGTLYSLMYHRFSDYESGLHKGDLLELKRRGKVSHIGVSLYSESELAATLEDKDVSIIQIPFHPLDASIRKKKLMEKARYLGKEIHVRSVFLQGLFFKKPDELTGNLRAFAQPLEHFCSLIKRHGVSVREACLNYSLHQPFIDRVIIGVETVQQLEENVSSVTTECPRWLDDELILNVEDQYLLNPSHWKP